MVTQYAAKVYQRRDEIQAAGDSARLGSLSVNPRMHAAFMYAQVPTNFSMDSRPELSNSGLLEGGE